MSFLIDKLDVFIIKTKSIRIQKNCFLNYFEVEENKKKTKEEKQSIVCDFGSKTTPQVTRIHSV